MDDPRVAAVGDNLEDFLLAAAAGDGFTVGEDTDVVAVTSHYPVPLFNAISGARFAPGRSNGARASSSRPTSSAASGSGYAVTAARMDLALERGASQVVLHASEAGYPVYRRLGFEAVCDVPQFVWAPGRSSDSS